MKILSKYSQRNVITIIVVLLLILGSVSGCSFSDPAETELSDSEPSSDRQSTSDSESSDEKVLALMFPDRSFVRESNGYRDAEGKLYIIRDIVEGSFILEGRQEKLVVIEVAEGLSHAEGFYQAYLAVFDQKGKEFLSSIKNFSADEGEIAFYKGKNKTYILFAGNSTFNGWTGWAGGLWGAGKDWNLRWPQDANFWEHNAVEVQKDGLKVLKRIIYPKEDQLIPEYEWEYSHWLAWDSDTANFIRVDN